MTKEREEYEEFVAENLYWFKDKNGEWTDGDYNVVDDKVENLWSWHQQSLDRAVREERERTRKQCNPNIKELIPVMDKTAEWYKFHNSMEAEIVFNNLTDDDGVVRQVPIKAVYESPIVKFQQLFPPVDVKKEK